MMKLTSITMVLTRATQQTLKYLDLVQISIQAKN